MKNTNAKNRKKKKKLKHKWKKERKYESGKWLSSTSCWL